MNKYRNQAKITWPLTLILVSTLITTVAIGLATWVNDNRQHFPVSDSSEGRALTKLYLGYSHDNNVLDPAPKIVVFKFFFFLLQFFKSSISFFKRDHLFSIH